MIFEHSRHVKIVVDLEIGDKVKTEGFLYDLDCKEHTITDIKRSGGCGSGIVVKIDNYSTWLDSNWLIKI